jgi:hypothetical protein
MSYLEQQQKVDAENEERERRKVKDEEARKILETQSSVLSNAANVTTIPLFDETQQNSANEDRKGLQTSDFSNSIITVKRKYIFILFLKIYLKASATRTPCKICTNY